MISIPQKVQFSIPLPLVNFKNDVFNTATSRFPRRGKGHIHTVLLQYLFLIFIWERAECACVFFNLKYFFSPSTTTGTPCARLGPFS